MSLREQVEQAPMRVRVTYETELSLAPSSGREVLLGDYNGEKLYVRPELVDRRRIIAVEKLTDPIPITPGTVLDVGGVVQERWATFWHPVGSVATYTDTQVQALADDNGFTVLREGQP